MSSSLIGNIVSYAITGISIFSMDDSDFKPINFFIFMFGILVGAFSMGFITEMGIDKIKNGKIKWHRIGQ